MAISTRLTELVGINTPIVSAPMAGVSGGALAAAVSRAGGFGFIAAGYLPPERVLEELDLAGRERVGVGFINWRVQQDRTAFDRVLERQAAAVFLSFGGAGVLADLVKIAGALLFIQVQSVEGAREAAALGADVIVVQGTEAGGHGAHRSLGPLLDDIVEADFGPVILAAGGICSGRAMASALVRGADGVLCGTAFYASEESLTHDSAKLRAIAASGESTERSDLFDAARNLPWPQGWTLRAARNAFSERWSDAAGLSLAGEAELEAFRRAAAEGNFDLAPVIVGEGIGRVSRVEPAAATLTRISEEAETALRAAPRLVRQ